MHLEMHASIEVLPELKLSKNSVYGSISHVTNLPGKVLLRHVGKQRMLVPTFSTTWKCVF